MEAFLLLQITIFPWGPTVGPGPFSKGHKEQTGQEAAQGLWRRMGHPRPGHYHCHCCVDQGESPARLEVQQASSYLEGSGHRVWAEGHGVRTLLKGGRASFGLGERQEWQHLRPASCWGMTGLGRGSDGTSGADRACQWLWTSSAGGLPPRCPWHVLTRSWHLSSRCWILISAGLSLPLLPPGHRLFSATSESFSCLHLCSSPGSFCGFGLSPLLSDALLPAPPPHPLQELAAPNGLLGPRTTPVLLPASLPSPTGGGGSRGSLRGEP